MKIRMNEDYGVTVDILPWLAKGEEVEVGVKVDQELAEMLLATDRAVLVESKVSKAAPEKAVVKTPETRARRPRARKGE